MKRVLVVPALVVTLAVAGCGSETKTVTRSASKPPTKTTFLKTTSPSAADTKTTKRTYLLEGRASPEAVVEVDGDTVTPDKDGHWSKKVTLAVGSNEIEVDASAPGFEDAETEYIGFDVHRTKAQIAADKAKREAAAARKRAAAEARFQRDVQAALNGSSKKMSQRVAREIFRQCSAGELPDSYTDVCFEAGFKAGGDIADKYAP